MSQDLITRYKKSIRIQYQNRKMESKYRLGQNSRGRSASVFAFAILTFLSLAFAFLEHKAFGRENLIPMYGYLSVAALAIGNLFVSQWIKNPYWPNLRLIINGIACMGFVIAAVYLQKYSAYHALEMSLLIILIGSLNVIRFPVTTLVTLVMASVFLYAMHLTEVSVFWMIIVAVLLLSAVLIGAYLSYILERHRRQLFLQSDINQDMTNRQETWAFTLIDLDMALSGIVDFGEVIGLLKKHLESVIEFESYILTSLEGQGPKPIADKMGGTLFEEDDKTLWSEDVLIKLTQTRQANISAEQEEVKGFLGRVKKRALSYRLDVPVISDSKLLGIISLRRSTEPFNDLDMVASVSIAAQAMMIFKRSTRNASMVLDGSALAPSPASSPLPTKRSGDITVTSKLSTTQSTDMEMTDQSFIDPNAQAGSGDKEEKGGKGKSAVKKTITLLSRENSDRIGREKYQTAVLEGDPLSILIIEIDGLSKLREQDGDQVAYRVFASIVRYIFSKVDKKKDTLGRYGQNGLSVLTPEIDMNAAEKFAEKIRKYVSKARYQTDFGEKSATLSIGVAAMTDETGNYNSMLKRADMALFVAKKNGRNCVKVRL
ncbi:MAG: diguanylate cyclase [Gammaproteobacteria bacterium]|nr:MAG: diguanylate cyclase [Gammaproteobacteria bacterium]